MKPSEILKDMTKDKWFKGQAYQWEHKYCISGFIIKSLFGDISPGNICRFGDMLSTVDKTRDVPLAYLWEINDSAATHEEAVSAGVEYLERVGL